MGNGEFSDGYQPPQQSGTDSPETIGYKELAERQLEEANRLEEKRKEVYGYSEKVSEMQAAIPDYEIYLPLQEKINGKEGVIRNKARIQREEAGLEEPHADLSDFLNRPAQEVFNEMAERQTAVYLQLAREMLAEIPQEVLDQLSETERKYSVFSKEERRIIEEHPKDFELAIQAYAARDTIYNMRDLLREGISERRKSAPELRLAAVKDHLDVIRESIGEWQEDKTVAPEEKPTYKDILLGALGEIPEGEDLKALIPGLTKLLEEYSDLSIENDVFKPKEKKGGKRKK